MSEPEQNTITDHTWDLYAEIGCAERHFNQLEHQYRLLASTWLLATFVAVGYMLVNIDMRQDDSLGLYKEFIIAAIALTGALGITLIWILDLKVYHQLLDCFFLAALELEDQHRAWLQPIRHNMLHTQKQGTVVVNVAWFYIGSTTALLVTAGFFLHLWLYRLVQHPASWGGFFAMVVFALFLALTMRRKSVSVSGGPAIMEHQEHRPLSTRLR